jgi:AraC-like DNA-binding protein
MHNPDSQHLGTPPSAAGSIARLACAQLKKAMVELEPILKKAGLTLQQIEDPKARLKVADQIRLLNLAAGALQDNLLGFHLAQPPDLREFGFLFYVMASSATLSEALQRGARYSSIANEGICLKYIDGASICITFHYVGVSRHLDRHQIEFWMVALVRMCRELTGVGLVPARVRLTHHRDNTSTEFSEFFGGDLEFDATVDEIAFATSLKIMPIVSADPYLSEILVTCCEEALAKRPRHGGSFQSRVENAIVPLLPHGAARAGSIARQLGVSQRTFARRLSVEGLSFMTLLEHLRSDLAQRYLTEGDLSISQIAWLLGYQEVSAFTHAFKRWTGRTPREIRSRVAS